MSPDRSGSARRIYISSLPGSAVSFTHRCRCGRVPGDLSDARSGSGTWICRRQLRTVGWYEQCCLWLHQSADRRFSRSPSRQLHLPAYCASSLACFRSYFIQNEVLPLMMDAYTHLDMSVRHPMDALESCMKGAGIDRAFVIETWSGDNRSCLDRMIAAPLPQFRVALCFRPEDKRSGSSILAENAVAGVRIRTADLEAFRPFAAAM